MLKLLDTPKKRKATEKLDIADAGSEAILAGEHRESLSTPIGIRSGGTSTPPSVEPAVFTPVIPSPPVEGAFTPLLDRLVDRYDLWRAWFINNGVDSCKLFAWGWNEKDILATHPPAGILAAHRTADVLCSRSAELSGRLLAMSTPRLLSVRAPTPSWSQDPSRPCNPGIAFALPGPLTASRPASASSSLLSERAGAEGLAGSLIDILRSQISFSDRADQVASCDAALADICQPYHLFLP